MLNLATRLALLIAAAALTACRTAAPAHAPDASSEAPYPPSRLITGVSWDFAAASPSRAALGSDLWPCTWARDDNLYCAWGDGGGFDGNDDNVGRVSLGFARIQGIPGGSVGAGASAGAKGAVPFVGKNVWGAPPYAENAATFGGKVVSMISVGGTLYAVGGFFPPETPGSEHRNGSGTYHSLAWSSDLGKSWTIAPWSTPTSLGTFLNFGPDNAGAPDSYVYLYYVRKDDEQQVFLKRIDENRLCSDPAASGAYEYFRGIAPDQRAAWSTDERDATAVFSDPHHVDYPEVVYDRHLRRYLMVAAHYPNGQYENSAPGHFGIFESLSPWGPWSTVAYYDDWGHYPPAGDFLGVHMPNKWALDGGKTRWVVFSGLHELDSFNLARARFRVHPWLAWLRGLVHPDNRTR